MRIASNTILILTTLFAQVAFGQPDAFKVVQLKTEYLVNPIGIDAQQPRLTWQMQDSRKDASQRAFEIFVGTDSLSLLSEKSVWSSGRIDSDQILYQYQSESLKSFTRYYWKVKLWNQDEELQTSHVASFETGMMDVSDWKGFWISDHHDIDFKPTPYFRKEFTASKKVKSARAYIAAAGLYELSLNGEKVGDHVLDPMYTRFDRRLLYVTYDVTNQITDGANALGVILGNGWYNHQSTAVWDFHNAPWRGRPAFCMDLRITYEDGTVETVSSGKDWKTSTGSIIFNSIYTAEHQDVRLLKERWNQPNFDDSKWSNVIYRAAPADKIVAQTMHPIRHVEAIQPKTVRKVNDSLYVIDFGRNIAGVTQLKVEAEAGTTVRLKHGERLGSNGLVDISNIDAHYRPTDDLDPFQTDIFITSGNGVDTFLPKFNYKGFQYVEVQVDRPLALSTANFTAYFMHSDVPVVGEIKTSSEMFNKLLFATNSSYLSNLFGYPTDCPQREKNGWTGDATIAIETGLYNFDGITIYEKWLNDHFDEQQPNGVLPSIIPTGGWGYEWGNGPDWTSTIAVIPWTIYQYYGDATLLERSYEHIKRYVDHIDDLYPTGLTTWGLGDWIPVKSKAPVELTSSVYYFADATIMAKAAHLLGNQVDEEKYNQLANKIKNAINDKYLDKETAIYGQGLQTELSVPLYWGVAPEDLKEKIAQNLADRVRADGNQLDVGLLGTKAILGALSQNGQAQVAYDLAARDTYPGWGWWIANGATTLYENWKIEAASDISMNHIMFGQIGAWFYKSLAGINPSESNPGFKEIKLTPNFPTGLDEVSGYHDGPYGRIISEWKRKGKTVEMIVQIPANSTAQLYVPTGYVLQKVDSDKVSNLEELELKSGKYQLTFRSK